MRLSWSRPTARRITAALAAGGLAAITLFNGPAGAAGSTVACTARSQSQVFSRWGDYADYFLMPDGGFEAGNEWVLGGGASRVVANEPWKVRAATDTRALNLPTGATAESRTICVAKGEETIRMFVKNPGVAGAYLRVTVNVYNPSNGAWNMSYFDIPSTSLASGWAPLQTLRIPTAWGYTGQQDMIVSFWAWGSYANWQIDDVYVDPFRST